VSSNLIDYDRHFFATLLQLMQQAYGAEHLNVSKYRDVVSRGLASIAKG
jgi:hypothetical protein